MTVYRVTVGGREYQVDVSGSQVRVNGESIQASLIPLNKLGLYLLSRGRQRRELHVRSEGRNQFAVMVDGRHVMAQVEKGARALRRKSDQRQVGDLVAPMPGMVISVHVNEGQRVERGQTLAVLESMKMQMELRAPFAGRVTRIAARVNTQVEKGTLLLQIAPA